MKAHARSKRSCESKIGNQRTVAPAETSAHDVEDSLAKFDNAKLFHVFSRRRADVRRSPDADFEASKDDLDCSLARRCVRLVEHGELWQLLQLLGKFSQIVVEKQIEPAQHIQLHDSIVEFRQTVAAQVQILQRLKFKDDRRHKLKDVQAKVEVSQSNKRGSLGRKRCEVVAAQIKDFD